MKKSLIMDNRTEEPLGYLWDLTDAGIQLVSEKSIPINRVFHLRLPTADQEILKARSVWCTKRADQPCFDTGFQIMESDPMALKKIKFILNRCVRRLNITVTQTARL